MTKTDTRSAWLSPEELRDARDRLPIVYVDLVPVRVDERSVVTSVGLLLRASPDGEIRRELVSGRVLYHERNQGKGDRQGEQEHDQCTQRADQGWCDRIGIVILLDDPRECPSGQPPGNPEAADAAGGQRCKIVQPESSQPRSLLSQQGAQQPAEAAKRELRGHDLCCYCEPGAACHADVLLRIANEEGNQA